jgi:hypothetical protein
MRLSPFPDGLTTARLHVEAGSPLAEVFLIDHDFELVERSVGDLTADVEPGVYKVKARLGETTTERLIVLNDDQEIDLRDELPIASPAPIEGTSLTHEFHMSLAAIESARVARSVGSGAQIFLLSRRWSSRSRGDAPEPSALVDLSLHDVDGRTIVDLAHSGSRDSPDWDPVAGTTVEVNPGAYLLRWCDSSGNAAEQTVEAVSGWQIQVFLLEDAPVSDNARRHEVSMLMSQHGFRPDDAMLKRVEEARDALADERKVASELISESLFAKFDNPMLGLFGAHLMLIAYEAVQEAKDEKSRRPTKADRVRAPVGFDQSLFDHVVFNLRNLLGPDHPDVVALSTKSSDPPPDALAPVVAPPMLWRSWLLLIEASNDSPELVPVAIWRRALRLMPMRPFLVWSPAEDDAEAAQQGELEMARSLRRGSPRDRKVDVDDRGRGAAAADEPAEGGRPTGAPHVTDDEARRRLTQELLAPRAAIDELIGGPSS